MEMDTQPSAPGGLNGLANYAKDEIGFDSRGFADEASRNRFTCRSRDIGWEKTKGEKKKKSFRLSGLANLPKCSPRRVSDETGLPVNRNSRDESNAKEKVLEERRRGQVQYVQCREKVDLSKEHGDLLPL